MSSSSTSPSKKYDIFVSFEGDCMKKTFISNLVKRLNQVGISHVKVDDKVDLTETNKAIPNDVSFALVVLSEDYVKSQPRRSELAMILERRRHRDLVVIPIFYMDRSKFSDLASKDGALAEVKKISGYYELKAAKSESELIDKIVERLVNQINSRYSEKIFAFGPSGGINQKKWKAGEIEGIRVCYADFIKSIDFRVKDKKRLERPAITYDGRTRENTFQVKLEKGEHITSLAGYFKSQRISSLTFRTNKRILGPINGKKEEENAEKEEYFYVPSKAGKVVEIFVTGDGFLGFIGARVELRVELPPEVSCSFKYVPLRTTTSQLCCDDANKRFENEIKTYRNVYLTSMSVTYKPDRITSLTLRPRNYTAETFGDKNGKSFSSPATDGKLVGFYEWSEKSDRQIGAYFETGPSQGENAWDDGKFDGVREIRGLVKENKICYVKFVYDNGSEKGRTITHGNDTEEDSSNEQEVKLEDYPREYLTWIYGSMGDDGSVVSLTFYSNRGGLGSIGIAGAAKPDFLYPSTGSRIVGFYGTWGDNLKSIGVHPEPIPHLYPFKTIGPFGGSGGEEWDDGVHTAVRGFRVIVGPGGIIQSISFRYDFNGSLVECLPHGERDNETSVKWDMLNFPEERLVGISFVVDRSGQTGDTTIRDLKIRTTNNDFCYAWTETVEAGGTSQKYISEKDRENKIVGFFGFASSSHLISIGAHLEQYVD